MLRLASACCRRQLHSTAAAASRDGIIYSSTMLPGKPAKWRPLKRPDPAETRERMLKVARKALGDEGLSSIDALPLDSLASRYKILAACEEAFNVVVHSNDLDRLTTAEALVEHFARDRREHLREWEKPVFHELLWSSEPLPSNLQLTLQEPVRAQAFKIQTYYEGKPKLKRKFIAWPAGAQLVRNPKGRPVLNE